MIGGLFRKKVFQNFFTQLSAEYMAMKDIFMPEEIVKINRNTGKRVDLTTNTKFTANSSQILFNSTVSGYSNLYLVDVPKDIHSLPFLEQ